jgi:hypothetical protein
MEKVKFTKSLNFKLLYPIVIGILLVSGGGLYMLYKTQSQALYDKIEAQNLSMVENLHKNSLDSIAKGQRATFKRC